MMNSISLSDCLACVVMMSWTYTHLSLTSFTNSNTRTTQEQHKNNTTATQLQHNCNTTTTQQQHNNKTTATITATITATTTATTTTWLFRGALQGKSLCSSLDACGDYWVRKGSYHIAWAVLCGSSCTCSYSYGQGPAVGPHTGRRCWPVLEGVWRAIAPLMKPWCAEGKVPTAANMNLYQGGNSCVGWHRDDQPLYWRVW